MGITFDTQMISALLTCIQFVTRMRQRKSSESELPYKVSSYCRLFTSFIRKLSEFVFKSNYRLVVIEYSWPVFEYLQG